MVLFDVLLLTNFPAIGSDSCMVCRLLAGLVASVSSKGPENHSPGKQDGFQTSLNKGFSILRFTTKK